MRIITHTCPNCGTVVAGNVLEAQRVMKCPRLNCDTVLRFNHLDEIDKEYLTEHHEKYRID